MTIAMAWQWYLKCVDGCGAEAGCECMGPDDKPALVVCDDRVLHIPKVSQRPPDSRCSFCAVPVKHLTVHRNGTIPCCSSPECRRARDRVIWHRKHAHFVGRQRAR